MDFQLLLNPVNSHSIMRSIIRALFFGTIMTMKISHAADVRVDVSLVDRDSLEVSIFNATGHEMRFETNDLPWVMDKSMLLILVPEGSDNPQPLKPEVAIQDPVSGEIVVPPGKTKVGRINLTERFPGIESRTGTRIVLFWFYRCRPIGCDTSEFGGYIVIPEIPIGDARTPLKAGQRPIPKQP